MDSERFDALSRALARVSTRRGLQRLLGALPLLGVLVTIVDDEQAGAKRRRKPQRRRADEPEAHHGNQHQRVQEQNKTHKKKHKKRKHKHRCRAESAAQTCAGKCGQVTNNCGSSVDCGSCACGAACPACQTCNATTGRCETKSAFIGQACGLPGQVCQADGTCVCDDASCADGQRCNDIVCVCDATSCPTGCCDGSRTCRIDEDAACGTGGGSCTRCTGAGVTCGGGGTPGQCGCTSQGCGTQTCGSTVDNCGQQIACSGCTGCCDGDTCRNGNSREACGHSGGDCDACSGVCGGVEGGVCSPCDASLAPCPGGQCCVAGACVASCPACQTCIGGACAGDSRQNRTTCQLPDGGRTGVCCNGTCCAGCCDAAVENGACGPCLAFITSTTSNGNLGGLAGADAKCQARAEAGGFWGSYQAWVSNAFGSPSSRFRCTAESCSSMGYVRVDEQAIASNWHTLTHEDLTNPINITELGFVISLDTGTWTQTRQDGTPTIFANTACQNWTAGIISAIGRRGQPEVTNPDWTEAGLDSCASANNSIYCFQQD